MFSFPLKDFGTLFSYVLLPNHSEQKFRDEYGLELPSLSSDSSAPIRKDDHQVLVGHGDQVSIFVDNHGDYALCPNLRARKKLFAESEAVFVWFCDMSNSFRFEYWNNGNRRQHLLVDTVTKKFENHECRIPMDKDPRKMSYAEQFELCEHLATEAMRADLLFSRWEICDLKKWQSFLRNALAMIDRHS